MKKNKKARWRARLHRLMQEKWGDKSEGYRWLKTVTGASHVGRCDEPMLHKAITELEILLGKSNPIGKPGPPQDTSRYRNLKDVAKPATEEPCQTLPNS